MRKSEQPSYVSFPIEEGLPGFLIPIFERGGEYVIESSDNSHAFVPIQYSDTYLHLSRPPRRYRVDFINSSSTDDKQNTHAFFDGETIYVGKARALVSHLHNNFASTLGKIWKDDPFVVAQVLDFIGSAPLAASARKAIRATQTLPWREILQQVESLPRITLQMEDRGSSFALRTDSLLRVVDKFAKESAKTPSYYEPPLPVV